MANLTAHIRPLISEIRIFDEGKSYEARDDFGWTCRLSADENDKYWIGLAGWRPTADERRALAKALIIAGYKEVFCKTKFRGRMAEMRIGPKGRFEFVRFEHHPLGPALASMVL